MGGLLVKLAVSLTALANFDSIQHESAELLSRVRLLATWWTVACQAPLSSPWDSPGKNIGVSCHFLLQAIFPTQGSSLGLPHCRQILDHLSHPGSLQLLVKYSCQSQVPPPDGEREAWEDRAAASVCRLHADSCCRRRGRGQNGVEKTGPGPRKQEGTGQERVSSDPKKKMLVR